MSDNEKKEHSQFFLLQDTLFDESGQNDTDVQSKIRLELDIKGSQTG